MPGLWRASIVLLATLLASNAAAKDERPSISPAPGWVSPLALPPPADAKSARPVDGVRYLLVDDQIALHLPKPVEFRRIAYEVVTGAGKTEASRVRVTFQPEYQSVAFHSIGIERDGVRRDVIPFARYDLLRQESSLEQGILDGARTWHVTLPDVRVGDRIEYAFSVVGANPVFEGRYYGDHTAAFSVDLPVRRIEVVKPVNRWLGSRMTHASFRHVATTSGGLERLSWNARNLKAYEREADAPGWADPGGRLELSEARQWRDVATWASGLYPTRFGDRRAAEQVAQLLELRGAAPSAAAGRALAFVQDQVRYTGIEIGASSHAPARPELTLERRFGDCKDKAVLLVALLAEAGIQAEPVLVDTDARATLREHLPSASAFDHVLARVKLGGAWFYVDPTLEHQAGPIETRSSLAYGAGLPIAADAAGLVGIPQRRAPDPDVEVEQMLRLTFDAATRRGAADTTVTTLYRRAQADRIRARFAADGAEGVGESYLKYMRGYYDDIEQLETPVLDEDDVTGQVRVTERYRIGWSETADGDGLGLTLFQILDWVPHRTEAARTLPLALDGPEWGRQRIRAEFANGWSIPDESRNVENAYFSLRRDVSTQGSALLLAGEWRRHQDAVSAADFVKVRTQLREARELLDYGVQLGAADPVRADDGQWPWILLALTFVAVTLGAAWRGRESSVLAGAMFRPRRTFASRESADRSLAVPLLAFVVLAISGALLDVDSVVLFDGDAVAVKRWGLSAGTSLAGSIVSAAGVYVMLRLMRHRVSLRELVRAGGYATLPVLVFLGGVLIAIAGDTGWIANDDSAATGSWPRQLVAVVLLLVGCGWTLVSTVRAYAGVADVRPSRALAAMFAFPVLIAAIALVAALALHLVR